MAKRPERTTRTKEGFAEITAFGKGDRRREPDPNRCSREQYEENWDRIFAEPEASYEPAWVPYWIS